MQKRPENIFTFHLSYAESLKANIFSGLSSMQNHLSSFLTWASPTAVESFETTKSDFVSFNIFKSNLAGLCEQTGQEARMRKRSGFIVFDEVPRPRASQIIELLVGGTQLFQGDIV